MICREVEEALTTVNFLDGKIYEASLEGDYTSALITNGDQTLIQINDFTIWDSDDRAYGEGGYENNEPIKEKVIENIIKLRDDLTKIIEHTEEENN